MITFGLLTNFVFVGQALFLGIVEPDEANVKNLNVLVTMLFMTGNGVLRSLDGANWFIKFLARISPLRYIIEGFMRTMIKQIPDFTQPDVKPFPIDFNQDILLKKMGFNYGNEECTVALLVWFAIWVLLGLFAINYKFRKL